MCRRWDENDKSEGNKDANEEKELFCCFMAIQRDNKVTFRFGEFIPMMSCHKSYIMKWLLYT